MTSLPPTINGDARDFPLAAFKGTRFGLSISDNPWRYSNRRETRRDNLGHKCRFGPGASGRYKKTDDGKSTMTIKELCAMPVKELVADNALHFMWVTGPYLAKGLHAQILDVWGFEPITVAFTWIKTYKNLWARLGEAVDEYLSQRAAPMFDAAAWLMTFLSQADGAAFCGPGNYTFSNMEIVILGRRGTPPGHYTDPETGKQRIARQLVFSVPGKHSAKPEAVQDRIEWMYPHLFGETGGLELFARRPRQRWVAFGNEV